MAKKTINDLRKVTSAASRLGRSVSAFGRYSSQSGGSNSIGGHVEKYARVSFGGVLRMALRNMGPFGRSVLEILDAAGKTKATVQDINAAVAMIQAAGGRVSMGKGPVYKWPSITPPPIAPSPGGGGSGSGSIPPGSSSAPSPQPPPRSGSGKTPFGAPPLPGEEKLPEIIYTPGSDNVFSFQFYPTGKRVGSLYVTFKANDIHAHYSKKSHQLSGTRGRTVGHSNGSQGATYEYLDVPTRVFVAFQKAAQADKAGEFVWDALRIRGTIYGHQYTYRLVSGIIAPNSGTNGGIYIPRRATSKGLRNRSLAGMGKGRRSFVKNALTQQHGFTTRKGGKEKQVDNPFSGYENVPGKGNYVFRRKQK